MNMFYESMLNEASFSVKDLEKVANAYGALFGKEFGGKFLPFNIEWYQKQKEKGQGVRMINQMGRMLRINFANRTSNFANAPKDFVVLSSIDFWEQGAEDYACPTTTCYFSRAVNVVKIWSKLGALIRNGKAGKYTIGDFTDSVKESVNEASIKDVRAEFLTKHGGAKSNAGFKNKFEDWVDTNGLRDEWNEYILEVEPGKPERNELEAEIKKTEKALADHQYCNPDTIFEEIELATIAITEQISRSFVLCGMGGLGKTYHVKEALKRTLGAQGVDWLYTAGKEFTPATFYDELFRCRDYITVFDEADSILTSSECIVMLKPVLDTTGSNTMEYASGKMPCFKMSDDEIKRYSKCVDTLINQGAPISKAAKGPIMWNGSYREKDGSKVFDKWNRIAFMDAMENGVRTTSGLKEEFTSDDVAGYWVPSKFFFTGGLIFVSNLPAKKIDQAIISRSIRIDLWLTATDVAKRIKDILSKPGYDSEAVKEAIEFLTETGETGRKKELTVRSGVMTIKLLTCKNAELRSKWKSVAKNM